jgi:ankyrin repeat protein
MLIRRGARPSTADASGDTPLHVACEYGSRDTAMVLLDAGADMTARNRKGWTPLHVACANGNMETAVALMDRGAGADAAAVELARSSGNEKLVNAIRERQ